jgi:hypothetical protein
LFAISPVLAIGATIIIVAFAMVAPRSNAMVARALRRGERKPALARSTAWLQPGGSR